MTDGFNEMDSETEFNSSDDDDDSYEI